MDQPRASKRARQACEPCRRKKTRCPGERPVCSYCQRLGQVCDYVVADAEDGLTIQNRQLQERLISLEAKMDRVIQQMSPRGSSSESTVEVRERQTFKDSLPSVPREEDTEIQTQEAGTLYLKWCHCQPMALFRPVDFLETLADRDEELVLAIKALSLRFPPGALSKSREDQLDTMAKRARLLVMQKLAGGAAELSSVQTLCILSFVNFLDGHTLSSSFDLAMAKQLAETLVGHSGRINRSLVDSREVSDCIRTVHTLHNLQSAITQSSTEYTFNVRDDRPSPTEPPSLPRWLNPRGEPAEDIVQFAALLSRVWKSAREYAAATPRGSTPPPWAPSSDYSFVMQQHLDLDCSVPLRYRFQANNIDIHPPETLQEQRHYWGPWLFIQIVYAAIPCLLNHPFLLSTRLRNFRYVLPQTFIQQSFEQITRHTSWICHFLDVLEEKQFAVSDPTLAHCVAIVATIHLQHSFVTDDSLSIKSRSGFEKCMGFLRRIGLAWRFVRTMVEKLERLQESVTESPRPGESAWTINASLLWDVLVYERAGCDTASMDQVFFGETLVRKQSDTAQDPATDFDLVGSAGIYGHGTVDKGAPLYPPRQEPPHHMMIPGTPHAATPRWRNGDGHEDFVPFGPIDPGTAFMDASQYGQAVENWLDFNL